MFTIVDSGLEKLPWQVVNDKSVNPVPATSFKPEYINGALEIFIEAEQQYGGALAHCARPLPTPFGGNPLPYVGFDLDIFIPDEAAAYMRCLEIDHKISVFDAKGQTVNNICDFSSQIETFNNGNIQIDNQGMSWTDIGLSTGKLPVDTWFHWAARYNIDVPSKKFSVLYFVINGVQYKVPTTLQGLNWDPSNWGQAVEPSLQLDVTQPCAFSVKYNNIVTTYSEQPF